MIQLRFGPAVVLLLSAACDAPPERVDATGNRAAADACRSCHSGERSLRGRDPGELAARIRAIRDGEAEHPPLALEDDGDAAIEALAMQLSEG